MHKIADYPMVKPPRWIANRFPLGEPNNIEELVELSTQISGDIYLLYHVYIWWFPEIGGTPKSSILNHFNGIVHYKPTILDFPMTMETPII